MCQKFLSGREENESEKRVVGEGEAVVMGGKAE